MSKYAKKFIVSEQDTAKKAGSGDLDVLATPVMVAMVENTAKDYLKIELTDEETSVGTRIEIDHLKASKIGAELSVEVICDFQEKRRRGYSFEVYDNGVLVGKGRHERAVVLTELFLSRLG
ncbi:thioesterase family protein [Enterococcus sp. LJL128]|uniref:thioesterase family protein n=1 Tax=Enterococcus sp. LJL51 TaxID=3416656 RepID=UPI003CFA4CEF